MDTYKDANFNALPIPRDTNGRFQKGAPGRPKGAKGKAGKETLNAIRSFGPAAIQKLWEAVNSGEKWAIELVIMTLVPRNSRTVEFEDFTIEDLKAAFTAGDISVSELKELVSAAEKIANISDMEEIKERLIKLQTHVDKQG